MDYNRRKYRHRLFCTFLAHKIDFFLFFAHNLHTDGVPVQPILSPPIPQVQQTDSRSYQKHSSTTTANRLMQATMPSQSHRMPDTPYNLEASSTELIANVAEKPSSTPDRIAAEYSRRPTRYNTQAVQTTLKSPGKSPGKSPRQMEIVRQKSESGRGRARGARASSSARGAASRAPVSTGRGRGRGRTPHAVPLRKCFGKIHLFHKFAYKQNNKQLTTTKTVSIFQQFQMQYTI